LEGKLLVYGKIYVPIDNSDHSNAAIEVAVRLAGATQARLVSSHVYAARMHDVRFKQMEYTLPEEYQHEQELERQRKIHDSLITRGLQLISDSYLDVMKAACDQAGVGDPGEPDRHLDGGVGVVRIIKGDVDLCVHRQLPSIQRRDALT